MIDNYQLFKEKLFKSCNKGETYYVIKILVRKKDFIANQVLDQYKGIFSGHSERLIYATSFSDPKEFERAYELVKILCDSVPYSRAYLNTNAKDTKKTMIELSNRVNGIFKDTLMGGTSKSTHRELFALSQSVTSLKECDADRSLNWTLLDIDYSNPREQLLVSAFIDGIASAEIEYLSYKTLNGIHILLSNKDAQKFKNPNSSFYKDYMDFLGNSFVDCKENASALLYANQI